MKRNIFLSAIVFCLASSLQVKSEIKTLPSTITSKPAPKIEVTKPSIGSNLKIVVLEMKKILATSEEGKDIEVKLMKLKSEMESEIKKLEAEIQKDLSELQTKSRVLDQATLEQQQEDILKKRANFESKAKSSQETFERAVNREIGKLTKKVYEKVISFAKTAGWDIVLLKETGEVIYCSEKADCSEEILKILNSEFKSPKAIEPKKEADSKTSK